MTAISAPGHAPYQSFPSAFESMTMYAPPYALRSTTHSRGTVAAAYACTSSRAVADHAPPLEVLAGLEAGRVDEREQRDVERVAPLHEARRPCADASMSSVPARCCGWFATTPTVRPSSRASAVTRFGRMVGAQLEEAVGVDDVVDDVAHVVRRVRRVRAPPPRHACSRGRRVAVGVPRRVLEVVIGQVVEDRSEAGERVGVVLDDEGSDAAAAARARPAPPRSHAVDGHAGERGAQSSGPVTYANASVVITTWSTSPSSSAGPDTHGPTTASRVGTTPDASLRARGDAAPGVQRRDALADVGARRRDGADHRDAELDPEATARSSASPSATPIAPRCLPPSRRNQLTVRPCRSGEGGADGVAALRHHRRRRHRREQRRSTRRCGQSPAVRTRVALCPPKPNEFEIAGRVADLARRPATTSSSMSSPTRSRLAVGGDDAVADREQRRDRLDRAGSADQVPGHALGRGDRRRRVAEDLADGLGFGGVVERRGRAVRVHVPDRRTARCRRRRARAACTRRRPRPRATAR